MSDQKQETRETVEAVAALDEPNGLPVNYKRVGEYLGIDKSAAHRRCQEAIQDGYLQLMTLISPSATVQPCNRIDEGLEDAPRASEPVAEAPAPIPGEWELS